MTRPGMRDSRARRRERLQGDGLDPVGGTPEEFGRFIRSEIAKWSKIAKDVGAKAE